MGPRAPQGGGLGLFWYSAAKRRTNRYYMHVCAWVARYALAGCAPAGCAATTVGSVPIGPLLHVAACAASAAVASLPKAAPALAVAPLAVAACHALCNVLPAGVAKKCPRGLPHCASAAVKPCATVRQAPNVAPTCKLPNLARAAPFLKLTGAHQTITWFALAATTAPAVAAVCAVVVAVVAVLLVLPII